MQPNPIAVTESPSAPNARRGSFSIEVLLSKVRTPEKRALANTRLVSGAHNRPNPARERLQRPSILPHNLGRIQFQARTQQHEQVRAIGELSASAQPLWVQTLHRFHARLCHVIGAGLKRASELKSLQR